METNQTEKAATGVVGLDDILGGGLSRRHLFLIEGEPGAGKTTVALQFLREGARQGERTLYVTLSETEAELRASAASHGWDMDPSIEIFELAPPESILDAAQQQSLIYAADLELGETTQKLFDAVERTAPDRVVLDSLSEVRLLAQSSLRYRRQVLAIKHYFARHGATVLMLDDLSVEINDKTVHSIAHAVIRLEQLAPDYGSERRRLRVLKYRGQAFRGGYHDFTIRPGGVTVFPRLVATEHRRPVDREMLPSGIAELDKLIGGGVDAGSSSLIIGPAGAGKSILALVFLAAAVARGERAALFVFDEELGLLFKRTKAMGIDLALFKTRSFAISAMFTGVAGSLGAIAVQFVSPDSFSVFLSITFFVGMVMGGAASIGGAVAGALFIEFVPNLAEHVSKAAPGAVYGIILIGFMFLLPGGMAAGLRGLARRMPWLTRPTAR